jgi:hypothetical protein
MIKVAVAGHNIPERKELVAELFKVMKIGDTVKLEREPSNPFDRNAIRVFYKGHHIGYVGRKYIHLIPVDHDLEPAHIDNLYQADFMHIGIIILD